MLPTFVDTVYAYKFFFLLKQIESYAWSKLSTRFNTNLRWTVRSTPVIGSTSVERISNHAY